MPKIKQIARHDLAAAVKKIKTPFYCYDASVIRSRYAALRRALPGGWRIYYAVKANPNVAILEIYREMGAMAECASAGEIMAALKAGYKGGEIALSGPVKTEAEYGLIKKHRPSIVHAETEEELRAINGLGGLQKVALRINLDLQLSKISKTGSACIMTGGNDKFGFSPGEAKKLLKRRGKFKHLDICGFHVYMGTQILSAGMWLKGARRFVEFAARLCSGTGSIKPSYVNLGGGFGIAYRENDSDFDLNKLGKGMKLLDKKIGKISSFSKAVFHIEPGRFSIGPAGVYVMKVVAVKKMNQRRYAMTDGGIHHALFPFRISREFPVKILNRKESGKKLRYILGGPLCTSLDQSELPVKLPELRPGDILGIYQSGSYGFSAGMQFFLSHPMPAEALIDGKKLRIIRKPSAYAHLFRDQSGL
ncbi:MAG: diaminopimelate decarboxylase [bacterium]|nr:MAG: diaminopimelate decarboxylase [bacterium]